MFRKTSPDHRQSGAGSGSKHLAMPFCLFAWLNTPWLLATRHGARIAQEYGQSQTDLPLFVSGRESPGSAVTPARQG